MVEPSPDYNPHWARAENVARLITDAAPAVFLTDLRQRLDDEGVRSAIALHNAAALFDWIVERLTLQGISNAAAWSFAARRPPVTWRSIELLMLAKPSCPLLRCRWSFDGCRFHKSSMTCAEPDHIKVCPLPRLPLRKGRLNQAVVGLWLFVRDVCRNDIVGWVDARLQAVADGSDFTQTDVRGALVEPLSKVPGKVSTLADRARCLIIAAVKRGGNYVSCKEASV